MKPVISRHVLHLDRIGRKWLIFNSLKVLNRVHIEVLLLKNLFKLVPVFRVAHLDVCVKGPCDLNGPVIFRGRGALLSQVLIVQELLLISEKFIYVCRVILMLTFPLRKQIVR